MGLFSAKKKTYVSSVIYNMAGDINLRPDYLKSVVMGNVITSSRFSMTDTLSGSYLNGPGLRMRRYYNWAVNNYQQVGIPSDSIRGDRKFSNGIIRDELERFYGFSNISISWVEGNVADITYWGLQWVLKNLPAKAEDEWTVDHDDLTNEATIDFEDATPNVSFAPNGYINGKMCLYIQYTQGDKGPFLIIYPYGSGSTILDNQMIGATTNGRYLPYIPIRHDNKFFTDSYKPELYELGKKAYKHAMNADYDDLIAKISENGSLSDIDYAYIAFGAVLNTKEQAAKRYLYLFFENCMGNQVLDHAEYEGWVDSLTPYDSQVVAWKTWFDGGEIGAEPTKPMVSSAPTNSVRIRDSGSVVTNFDMEIVWSSVTQVTGAGLGKTGAKRNEVWLEYEAGTEKLLGAIHTDETTLLTIGDKLKIWKQIDENSWSRLDVVGLVHRNNVYNGKYVETTMKEAMDDPEESGFLVPINYDLLKSMSLIDSTQMATASAYVVFNCYQIVKQKWYQTGWFKILLIIAVVVITVLYPPAGATAGGILGSSASVGAALGFAGVAALIAGTVANIVAAMILTKILTKVSTEIFGDKIGRIIAAVATIVTMNVANGMSQGLTLTQSLSNLTSAMGLIQLTSAIGNGVAQAMGVEVRETVQKTQELMKQYDDASAKIQQAYADEFGYGTTYFDPTVLTNQNYAFESSDSFLARTLMTGSDIANFTASMVDNFAELTLRLDLPS